MESIAKLIYKTQSTKLPTSLPAYFYGLPNGKVYIIYSRFYEVDFSNSALEFVFAVHKEFSFDYKNETLISSESQNVIPQNENNLVDIPDPKIKIIKVSRKVDSYREAVLKLEKKALKKAKKSLL